MKIRRFFGSKSFYKSVLAIAIPVMVQSGITQFVSVLDNIMVGRVGTEQMSGVAIANQLIFVFNLCIFGGLSGAGIFGAQFAGKNDSDGIRNVFRFKLIVCILITVIGMCVLGVFGSPLVELFLHEGSADGDLAATLVYGRDYLYIMLVGLVPYALAQCYASTLRETGETVLPMIGSGAAVLLNLLFNYLLIFGRLGFPALGVNGAAIATVISRFAELAIMCIRTHIRRDKYPYFIGAYRSLRIPRVLTHDIIVKGTPLLLNETLWSAGMSMLTQCYSMRGLAAVAAINITGTVSNLFNVVYMSIGSSIGIIVGNLLGANRLREARDTDTKIITLSVIGCFVIGGLLAAASGLIPRLYNTTHEVMALASSMLLICALMMPFQAFTHACYFTLRSGGQTRLTMLFDCGYVWVVCVPVAYVLSRFTALSIIPLYFICTALELIKCAAGFFFVKSDMWMKNIIRS